MISTDSDPINTVNTSEFSLGERRKLIRRLGLFLVIIAAISMLATLLFLLEFTPLARTDGNIRWALSLNAGILVLLFLSTASELVMIWMARRSGKAAARLHIRVVTLFSFLALVPALIVAVFASITLDQRLERFFSSQVTGIIEASQTVADAYLKEHLGVLRANLLDMAEGVDRARQVYEFDPSQFDRYMLTQTTLRQMPVAFLLDGAGDVVTRTLVDPSIDVIMPLPSAMQTAAAGEPVLITQFGTGQVGGLVKLRAYDDFYLYVIRKLDVQVTNLVDKIQQNAGQLRKIDESRPELQGAYALFYIGIALMLLLLAIWIGIGFSDRLVTPIRRLMTAADHVSRGNLHVQVPVKDQEGDFANLGAMFNTMTQQLRTQRDEILSASEQENQRRKFTETVLAGVTASVIGIDQDGCVTIANKSALETFEVDESDLIGTKLVIAVPELEEFLAAVLMADRQIPPKEISIVRGQQTRTLAVRATGFAAQDKTANIIVTLDDITDLVSAQRSAAWADVARRIAHEIKNPLTPIQLSAERIRRRYGKQIDDGTEVFDQCVDTIIRQVGDIGRMVDEFSSFARMPKPVMQKRELGAMVREAVFLQSVGFPDIEYKADIPETGLSGQFDERLIVQAVSNLVKNASEAVGAFRFESPESGKISVSVRKNGPDFIIDVEDNGPGFPVEARDNLLEPYMTTREKGTGLGLAIVRKIIEEHNGQISLLDASSVAEGGHGALVRVTLSQTEKTEAEDQTSAASNENKSTGLKEHYGS